MIFLQHGTKHLFVEAAEVEDPDLAVKIADIFHNFMGAGFPQREFVRLRREPLDQLYKGIDSKGVVLGGNGAPLPCLSGGTVVLVEQVCLFYHLSGVGEKLSAVLREGDSSGGTVENENAEFFFQRADSTGKRRLCHVKLLGSFADRAVFHNGNDVLQLL